MRRRNVRISERAADDLTAVYDYISDANPVAAKRVVNGIKAKIRSIAALGLTGTSNDPIKSDLRVMVVRHYLIYFRITPSYLLIVRILHGRRNITAEDVPESDMT